VDVTTTELTDVSRDLCVLASLLFAADQAGMVRALVDQAAELLIFRGLLARSRRSSPPSDGSAKEVPTSVLVPSWMN